MGSLFGFAALKVHVALSFVWWKGKVGATCRRAEFAIAVGQGGVDGNEVAALLHDVCAEGDLSPVGTHRV